MADDERPDEQPAEGEPAAEDAAQAPPEPQAGDAPAESAPAAETPAPGAEEQPPEAAAEAPVEAAEPPAEEAEPAAEEAEPRAKPEIPGADLEVDIVPEGSDPLAQAEAEAAAEAAALEEAAEAPTEAQPGEEPPEPAPEARPRAAIDLGADARYKATGKRKSAIARVILKPGSGAYAVNGHPLEQYFPRATAQRNIREPLETVGYEGRMDVVASLHGGGVSAQAGALRHGISRALLEADPNLRIELKRRGFLTRDARVKERRKAGLKKARKRPQFSKR
jgi:small subunit ribosomal protein S9